MNSTMESMNDKMPEMMGNQFFGEVSDTDPKECAIMGLIKNQIIVLGEELNEAQRKLGIVSMEEENWSAKYERKMECKVLQGKIDILTKLKNDFECMLTPMHSAA